MPRANRYLTAGRYYHVTHRCHDRAFLLKFAKDRDLYRKMLREQLGKHPVHVLGYCLTSNHVHLLLTSERHAAIGEFMGTVAGEFARAYNRRKHRENAFWGGRYHATLVDSESYLWRCLRYIDLNMVRAGVVEHPREWAWCGYQEVSGNRVRYRLIDRERLLLALRIEHEFNRFRESYLEDIDHVVGTETLSRQAAWTESLAVGSESFVQQVAESVKNRSRLEVERQGSEAGAWILREARASYA